MPDSPPRERGTHSASPIYLRAVRSGTELEDRALLVAGVPPAE